MWRQLFGVEIIELFYYNLVRCCAKVFVEFLFCARKGVQHRKRRLGSVNHVAQVENVVCHVCALFPIAPRWHKRLRSLLFSVMWCMYGYVCVQVVRRFCGKVNNGEYLTLRSPCLRRGAACDIGASLVWQLL